MWSPLLFAISNGGDGKLRRRSKHQRTDKAESENPGCKRSPMSTDPNFEVSSLAQSTVATHLILAEVLFVESTLLLAS